MLSHEIYCQEDGLSLKLGSKGKELGAGIWAMLLLPAVLWLGAR